MDQAASRECSSDKGKFQAGLVGALVKYADNEFELMSVQKDGCTLRSHYESVERQTGRFQERLHRKRPRLAHLFDWFTEINRGRTGNGYGPNPILYSEIQAWSCLTGIKITPSELGVLKTLDSIYLNQFNRRE